MDEELDDTDIDGFEDDGDEENENVTDEYFVADEVYMFLKKVRSLVRLSRKSGIVSGHVTRRIKQHKIKNAINFILDFHVRWNSTYLMLERLKKLKIVAEEITNDPDSIQGLKPNQKLILEDLMFTSEEWSMCEILLKVLQPFFHATKILSARKYPTLAASFLIQKNISAFLSNTDKLPTKERKIMKFLFEKVEHHLFKKISKEQKLATKVRELLFKLKFNCTRFKVIVFR